MVTSRMVWVWLLAGVFTGLAVMLAAVAAGRALDALVAYITAEAGLLAQIRPAVARCFDAAAAGALAQIRPAARFTAAEPAEPADERL